MEAGQFFEAYGGKEFQTVSGQRAFRLAALEPWLGGNPKWCSLMKGFYEPSLNFLIPRHDVTRKAVFNGAPAHRTSESRSTQERDFDRAQRIVWIRGAIARKIREKRKTGDAKGAKELLEKVKKWNERMRIIYRK